MFKSYQQTKSGGCVLYTSQEQYARTKLQVMIDGFMLEVVMLTPLLLIVQLETRIIS